VRDRLTLDRQQRVVIDYGFDAGRLGFFATVVAGRARVLSYSALQANYAGLPGLLKALQDAGVFDVETVQNALDALVRGIAADIADRDQRAVAQIVEALKRAAAE
jgi:hypothetical protein